MSAPNTNIETQKRKHRFPLVAIAGVVGLAALAALAFVAWDPDINDAPVEATDPMIDGNDQ